MRASVVVALLLLSAPRVVHAEEPATKKRPVPNMDGREPEATSAADVFIWIPRVVLSPFYLVSEYVFRWPLSVLLPAAERVHLPKRLYDFFAFGPDHRAGIVPTAFVEFGFLPSVGFVAFYRHEGTTGHDVLLHVGAWPSDWIGGSLSDHLTLDRTHALAFHAGGVRRPDRVFFGIGPRSLQQDLSRYTEGTFEAGGGLTWRFWRSSHVDTDTGVRSVSILHGGASTSDPSIEQQAATGAFPVPYGFDRGYTDVYGRLRTVVDSRRWIDEDPALDSNRTGVRVELGALHGSDVRRAPYYGFVRWGGTAAGYWDVDGHRRVLGLAVTALFADPLSSQPIPFPELVQLGGDHFMPGYYPGRLQGRSAAVATLSYNWPIGPWLDGSLEVATGNVFDAHFDGMKPSLLRCSGALGVSIVGFSDPPVQLLVGVGSETFEHGGQVDSLHAMIGVPHGF